MLDIFRNWAKSYPDGYGVGVRESDSLRILKGENRNGGTSLGERGKSEKRTRLA